jgi:uncharacterized surface protein with fasciclin (FAS1) repeats
MEMSVLGYRQIAVLALIIWRWKEEGILRFSDSFGCTENGFKIYASVHLPFLSLRIFQCYDAPDCERQKNFSQSAPQRIKNNNQINERNNMKRTIQIIALALTLAASAALADNTVIVGGQSMFPAKNIIENAVNSKDHTTLVAAVKAAGLVDTLEGAGPFTVFAPTDAAFGKLPAGTVDNLVKPENKEMLTKILTYHVVPGRLTFKELPKQIKAGGGKAELTTVSGDKLWVMMNGEHNIVIQDDKGNVANISTYDVMQSNGVIHVIDTVLMP